jgi:hypothetical protein
MMMQSRRRKRLGAGGEKRHGTEKHIIFINAGNDLDVYQYVSFARQYGLDIKRFLQSIVVSRMFTIYQLANTIICDLPKIIIQPLQQQPQQQQNFEPKVIDAQTLHRKDIWWKKHLLYIVSVVCKYNYVVVLLHMPSCTLILIWDKYRNNLLTLSKIGWSSNSPIFKTLARILQ